MACGSGSDDTESASGVPSKFTHQDSHCGFCIQHYIHWNMQEKYFYYIYQTISNVLFEITFTEKVLWRDSDNNFKLKHYVHLVHAVLTVYMLWNKPEIFNVFMSSNLCQNYITSFSSDSAVFKLNIFHVFYMSRPRANVWSAHLLWNFHS